MKLSIRKTLFISLALMLVLAIAALGITLFRVNRTVTVPGRFEYRMRVPVVAKEPGYVAEIFATPDQNVNKGELLLLLENRNLDREVLGVRDQLATYDLEIRDLTEQSEFAIAQLRRDIESNRLRLQTKSAELESQRELFVLHLQMYESDSITKYQYDDVRLRYLAIQNEVRELEIGLSGLGDLVLERNATTDMAITRKTHVREIALRRLDDLDRRRDNLRVVAPESGMLLAGIWSELIHTYVSATTVLGRVVTLDQIIFSGFAQDSDIIRVETGQSVYFDVDVFRRKAFVNGTVTSVGYAAIESSDRNLFPVQIEVENAAFFDRDRELYIRAGVTGEAIIITEEGLSLIELVWEKIRKLADFEVYAQ